MSYTKMHDWVVGTKATRTAANAEPYALTDGNTVTVSLDGEADLTFTVDAADYANVAAATATEVAAAFKSQIPKGLGAADVSGTLELTNDRDNGTDSTLEVTGGTDAAVLGFPAGVDTGTGDGAVKMSSHRCGGLPEVRLSHADGEFFGWEASDGTLVPGTLVKPSAAKQAEIDAQKAALDAAATAHNDRQVALDAVRAKRDASDPLTDADRDVIVDAFLGRI